MEEMTYTELTAEIASCREEIAFWAMDLRSPDSDEVAEARRCIRAAERQLEKVEREIERQERVRQ